MPGTEILLCVVGAFYAFAGYVATRAALTSHFLDRAIAAIGGGKPNRVEQAKTYWLLGAASIVLAAGAALLFLLDVAVWLFAISAAGQAIYLVYLAPKIFDAAEEPDPAGRRQTINAFVIFLAATALVVWAYATGRLVPLWQAAWPALVVPAALVVANAAYVLRMLATSPKAPRFGALGGADTEAEGGDPASSTRIKVMADYHCHPLWALDGAYGPIAPEALDLSDDLTRDLNEWADAFTASLDMDDPATSRWTDAEAKAHASMARPLAVRLARERPERTIYVHDGDIGVVEVHPDEDDTPSGGRGAGI